MTSLNEQILKKEAELNKLKEQKKAEEVAEKAIVGAIVIKLALSDNKRAIELINILTKEVKKKSELKNISGLLSSLEEVSGGKNKEDTNTSTTSWF